MNTVDTIAALATAPGGAINIVRISGSDALAVANKVWRGKQQLGRENARKMLYGLLGDPGEPVLAVYMPCPHSYTGEDVVELQCHGGAAAGRRTLDQVLMQENVRSAEPGEFTMRAFVNGKLDLAQAEAVGDLVSASSEASFNLALRQLEGNLSRSVNDIREILLLLAADCESRLDFPDEELEFDPPEMLLEKLARAREMLNKLIASAHAGNLLREGVRITLAGRPNAGKSSLLNALLGVDRAIVSNIPGTTRDTLAERAVLRNIPVEITDTAGLRESDDEIETLGIQRARNAIKQSQLIFYLLDASADEPADEVEYFLNNCDNTNCAVIAIWNKCDLVPGRILPDIPHTEQLTISARTGENLDLLLDWFEKIVWAGESGAEDTLQAVNARHLELLQRAANLLENVPAALSVSNWELAALDLHMALREAGKIVGETVEPDILDEIFSRFCIGK